MKNPLKTIMVMALCLLGVLILWVSIRNEEAAARQVPAEKRIKDAILSSSRLRPEELDVLELPASPVAPLYLRFEPDTLARIYEVGADGKKFFPDYDARGTSPILKMRVRIDGKEDTIYQWKRGDNIPNFRRNGFTEIWISFEGFPGAVYLVVEKVRRHGIFS